MQGIKWRGQDHFAQTMRNPGLQVAGRIGCAPGRAMNASKQMLGATVRVTRREIRAARRRSAEFARGVYSRANVPLQNIQAWQRGGLNE